MKRERTLRILRTTGHFLQSAGIFFLLIAFVVTVSFLLFFHGVEPDEEAVRAIAPIVFFNVVALSMLFAGIDMLRRYLTVTRPTQKIIRVLERLSTGDFTARVGVGRLEHSHQLYPFAVIARQINRLGEELSGVETLRSDFISNVSHELKTPLTIMQNYATLLRAGGLSDEEREAYARRIFEASRRLSELVTNILRLDKLEHQQIFPVDHMTTFDLGEQLCECLLSFEERWEEKGLRIETDIAEDITVRADEELLSLVWNNLISNAVKFTETGGSVSVGLAPIEDGQRVSVTVSDTGCGMSAEVGAHIFERFYQGDASHATGGNGLGLSLVKRVVDILHGEIHVSSTPGVGSQFTVILRRDLHA